MNTHDISYIHFIYYSEYEPPHVKTNKMTSVPIEASDQPGHLPSLIRVFAVCMKTRLMPRPSLRWAHMSFCWSCHVADHITFRKQNIKESSMSINFG